MKKALVFLLPTLVVAGAWAWLSGAWEEWGLLRPVTRGEVSRASVGAAPEIRKGMVAAAPAAPKDENEARLEQGRKAAKGGNIAAAQDIFADLMRRFPSSTVGGKAAVEMAAIYKGAGDLFNERNTLSRALGALGEDPMRQDVVAELHKLNGELVFSRKPVPDGLVYTVQKGDSLDKIAKRYKITAQLIRRINNLSSDRIRIGEDLKVFEGPFEAVIEKAKFRLTVYRAGIFIKEYRIGIGKNGSTPEGEFGVENKLVDPTWDPPGPEYAASKAADNPLGTRWIGFDREYGIHGTIEPESIGKAESRGCVRLLNSDVEELYDLLIITSKVTVKP